MRLDMYLFSLSPVLYPIWWAIGTHNRSKKIEKPSSEEVSLRRLSLVRLRSQQAINKVH